MCTNREATAALMRGAPGDADTATYLPELSKTYLGRHRKCGERHAQTHATATIVNNGNSSAP